MRCEDSFSYCRSHTLMSTARAASMPACLSPTWRRGGPLTSRRPCSLGWSSTQSMHFVFACVRVCEVAESVNRSDCPPPQSMRFVDPHFDPLTVQRGCVRQWHRGWRLTASLSHRLSQCTAWLFCNRLGVEGLGGFVFSLLCTPTLVNSQGQQRRGELDPWWHVRLLGSRFSADIPSCVPQWPGCSVFGFAKPVPFLAVPRS
jgi:hypothetical protein